MCIGENEEHAANCNIHNIAPVTMPMPQFERVASELKSSSFSVTITPKTRFSQLVSSFSLPFFKVCWTFFACSGVAMCQQVPLKTMSEFAM